jgi:hypothetical protein
MTKQDLAPGPRLLRITCLRRGSHSASSYNLRSREQGKFVQDLLKPEFSLLSCMNLQRSVVILVQIVLIGSSKLRDLSLQSFHTLADCRQIHGP